jgi:tetratricopeptide (TPR) repeat protein
MQGPGHATEAERRRARHLQTLVSDGECSEHDLLELALLYFEPFHQEEQAIQLLEDCLERGGAGWRTRLWLAYLYLHHRMDAISLRQAQTVLSPLIDQEGEAGAGALQLLSQIGRELGDLDTPGEAAMLQESVKRKADWVLNRYLLAACYRQMGRREDALHQLDAAAENCGNGGPTSIEPSELEIFITGRVAFQVQERLRALRLDIEKEGSPPPEDPGSRCADMTEPTKPTVQEVAMRALIATQADLSELNDALHDRWLKVDELTQEADVVRIPITTAPDSRPRDSAFRTELRIEPVESVLLADREQIGSYDLSFIELIAADRSLRFHCNIPIELEIRLRQLPVTILLADRE